MSLLWFVHCFACLHKQTSFHTSHWMNAHARILVGCTKHTHTHKNKHSLTCAQTYNHNQAPAIFYNHAPDIFTVALFVEKTTPQWMCSYAQLHGFMVSWRHWRRRHWFPDHHTHIYIHTYIHTQVRRTQWWWLRAQLTSSRVGTLSASSSVCFWCHILFLYSHICIYIIWYHVLFLYICFCVRSSLEPIWIHNKSADSHTCGGVHLWAPSCEIGDYLIWSLAQDSVHLPIAVTLCAYTYTFSHTHTPIHTYIHSFDSVPTCGFSTCIFCFWTSSSTYSHPHTYILSLSLSLSLSDTQYTHT